MKIPAFWAKATYEAKDKKGKDVFFACWRWSYNNLDEAKHAAAEAVRKICQRFINEEELNRYLYSDRPVREEIIREIKDGNGELIAVITRNTYGALVLNTAKVMFVDIDNKSSSVGNVFRKLFGGKSVDKDLEKLKAWSANNPHWGLRVYKTFNGYRVMITHDLFDPKNEATMTLMNEFGCDELYMRLCRIQECFRARLTPKPWRCRMKMPPNQFPREDSLHKEQFNKWLEKYNAQIAGYNTCKLVDSLGNNQIHPEIEPFIKVHDKVCCLNGSNPLA